MAKSHMHKLEVMGSQGAGMMDKNADGRTRGECLHELQQVIIQESEGNVDRAIAGGAVGTMMQVVDVQFELIAINRKMDRLIELLEHR